MESQPLAGLDEWDADVRRRYGAEGKPAEAFRDYRAEARPSVREFYRLNHRHQTFDFVQDKRRDYLQRNRREMGVWEAMEFLDTLVDDSDPDTDLSQIEHLLQTAERIRADGRPRWFQLTGLIHDLGKILCLFGEPQWALVGDTFPVGCPFADEIVFSEFFEENPDRLRPEFQSPTGVYAEHCGLENVDLSWGHDEYLYHVVKGCLPAAGLAMIRYHSCYPIHREGAYRNLLAPGDEKTLAAVRAFNPYDLYSKADDRPDVAALRPYYEELIAEYFPTKLRW